MIEEIEQALAAEPRDLSPQYDLRWRRWADVRRDLSRDPCRGGELALKAQPAACNQGATLAIQPAQAIPRNSRAAPQRDWGIETTWRGNVGTNARHRLMKLQQLPLTNLERRPGFDGLTVQRRRQVRASDG
ncbi:hypothetical protein D9M70_531720 [compost metagenome]